MHNTVFQGELPFSSCTVDLLELAHDNVVSLKESLQIFLVALIIIWVKRLKMSSNLIYTTYLFVNNLNWIN